MRRSSAARSSTLQGRIPTVAQLRDFESEAGSFKRQDLVDRLQSDTKQPDRFAQRTADNLARVWRRMMIPSASPGAAMGPQLDPWLARQFAANTSYDQIARKLLLVQPPVQPMMPPTPSEQPAAPPDPDAAAIAFQQAVGQTPDMLASAYVRVFLGVRINCAQCHDHPMADWKKSDFWGVAAMFNGTTSPKDMPGAAPTIKPQDEEVQYAAKLLWQDQPLKEIPAEKSPREVLADWLVSPENPNFAATAVNRVWQYLCGRGLAGAVDELDRVTAEERKILDELAELFKASGHDLRWLITGICKSKVYQQQVVRDAPAEDAGFCASPTQDAAARTSVRLARAGSQPAGRPCR